MANKPTVPRVLGNNISTTLASGIDDNDLTISVASGAGMNSTGGYALIDPGLSTAEIVYVESVSSNTLTLSTDGRGLGDTSAVAHTVGAVITDVLVDDHLEGFRGSYLTEHADDGSHLSTSSVGTGWLAAGETWTYASADDPTFTFTISGDKTTKYSAGMRIRVSQSTGGTKYFIITKVEYSSPNTTITVFGGTDYNLENETISSPYYSLVKAPYGFPLDPAKWSVVLSDTGVRTQNTPTTATWYNLGSLSIVAPIGVWHGYYDVYLSYYRANSGTSADAKVTLSTANNSESNNAFTWLVYTDQTSYTLLNARMASKNIYLATTAKTTYYLNTYTDASLGSIAYNGNQTPTTIILISAYL